MTLAPTAQVAACQALERAMRIHGEGDRDTAFAVHQLVLDDHPRQADVLQLKGKLEAEPGSPFAAFPIRASPDEGAQERAVDGHLRVVSDGVAPVEAPAGVDPVPGRRNIGADRDSHRWRSLRATLADAGFAPLELQAVVLRNGGRRPVDGWLVAARSA